MKVPLAPLVCIVHFLLGAGAGAKKQLQPQLARLVRGRGAGGGSQGGAQRGQGGHLHLQSKPPELRVGHVCHAEFIKFSTLIRQAGGQDEPRPPRVLRGQRGQGGGGAGVQDAGGLLRGPRHRLRPRHPPPQLRPGDQPSQQVLEQPAQEPRQLQ